MVPNGKTKPWKQLYQQYTLKTDNLTDITDISVRNVTNGIDYGHQAKPRLPDDVPQDEWDSDYANHWYIADVTDDDDNPQPYVPGKDGLTLDGYSEDKTVEIGWNIPTTVKTNSIKFTVSFTMHDVATKWKDVETFQWEPFGENNQVPIGTVTGTVHFPKGVTASNSWTWLHTEQTSETGRTKDGSFTFTVNDVKSGEYLDVVAAFNAAKAGDMARVETDDHLQELKEDEADDERFWRNLERQRATRRLNNWMTTISAGLIFGIIGVVAALRSSGRSRYRGSIEYWRDRPELSPASAAKLIDIVTSGDKPDISERVGRTAFDMDDIKDACKDWKDGYKELEKFTNACKTEFATADIAPKTENGWLIPGAITVLIGGASIFINGLAGYLVAGALIGIPLMTVGIFCFLMGNSYVLTDHGQQMPGNAWVSNDICKASRTSSTVESRI